MLQLLYFAQLKEQVNCEQEYIEWHARLRTLGDLKAYLCQRDAQWAHAFANNILAAVNQDMAKDHHPIKEGDEIAFFPPVTGG